MLEGVNEPNAEINFGQRARKRATKHVLAPLNKPSSRNNVLLSMGNIKLC